MKKNDTAGEQVSVQTDDGWTLKFNRFTPRDSATAPRAIVVILPAMGAHARPYRFMAQALADMGNAVYTVDPRGHGQSRPLPRRGIDYGIDDFLKMDIPAILEKTRQQSGCLPIFLIGHSYGGHLSAVYAAENPGQICGVITLTTSQLYYKIFSPVSLILYSMFSVLAKTMGYVPGQHLGWGTPMARQQVLDWARWGFSGKFRGTDGRRFEPLIKEMQTPGLCIGFTDDSRLGPPKAIRHFSLLFPDDKVTHWSLSPTELEAPKLGHFDHLRTGTNLWPRLDRWISEQI